MKENIKFVDNKVLFSADPADTRRWINVGLTLFRRLRRRTNFKRTMVHCLMFAGDSSYVCTSCRDRKKTQWGQRPQATREATRIPGEGQINEVFREALCGYDHAHSHATLVMWSRVWIEAEKDAFDSGLSRVILDVSRTSESTVSSPLMLVVYIYWHTCFSHFS